jgi:ATP-binding cassette subfamily B protein
MYGGGPPVYLMWSGMFNPERNKLKRKIEWGRIRSLFHPYKKEVVLLLILVAVQSAIGLAPSILTVSLVDKAIPHKSVNEVLLCTGGMIAAGLFSGGISVLQGFVNAGMAEGVMRDLRCQIVAHLQRMPLEFFAVTRAGELLNRVSSDIDSLDDVVSGTITTIISNVLVLITTLITMFWLDWRLAIMAVLLLPVMIFPLWPVGRGMYKQRKITRQKRDEVANRSQETLNISGVTLTKIFGMEDAEHNRFLALCNDLMHSEITLSMIGRWFMMIVMTMTLAGPALVWMGGAYMVVHGYVGLGTVIAFIALITRLYGPASSLTGVQVQIAGALAVFERIFDYLDLKQEDYETGEPLDEAKLQGSISFDDVHFAYTGGSEIFSGLTFSAKPGEFLAVVGSSGAGKSTLAALIPRFYKVQKGKVCLDGKDINEIKLSSLRKQIGIVTQESFLFHASIKDNLLYANAQASMEQIIDAAKAANIHEFILSLPEGYDTIAGERGYKLSGGERQRLSIARAILKNPRILILDEATSSLDNINESAVQAALNRLMKGRTSIVIAHRLSTIQNADRIIVLEKGQIVESGTHDELLRQNGTYSNLYTMQQQQDSEGVVAVAEHL